MNQVCTKYLQIRPKYRITRRVLNFPLKPTARSSSTQCNFANPKQRVNGGWNGITQVQCESMGHCFDDTYGYIVWCFKSQQLVPSGRCDFKNPKKRVAYGPAEISKQECLAKRNCFDDSTPNAIKCFLYNIKPKFAECEYRTFIKKRIDAGWSGISENECESRGNCFDDRYPGVPFCFEKNK